MKKILSSVKGKLLLTGVAISNAVMMAPVLSAQAAETNVAQELANPIIKLIKQFAGPLLGIVGAVGAIFVIILGVLFFNGAKQTYEKKPEDPESATISLEYAQVVRKDTRKVTSGRGKHKTSHTEYNIYLSDGRELSVVKYVYNEVDGAGNYYIGKNEAGSIFGMYPESSYCMEEI